MHGWDRNNGLYGIYVASTIDINLNPNEPIAMVYLDHYNIEKVNKSYAYNQCLHKKNNSKYTKQFAWNKGNLTNQPKPPNTRQ